ncbi:MAG: YegS/Rv2252/BmrU family lipid kinase [Clostridia bacterium]|nr:YegS/Rv2252/BmrU family lipid kinase [Clostridia bacterium]
MDKKMLLLVNPCSGKAKMRTELLSVVQTFCDADYDVTIYTTKERADATKKVMTLKNGQFDLIVVCGGDGTLNEVITGLMNAKIKCVLGYIPSGTLNEWSSSINISRSIKQAAKDIINAKVITLDIGKFGDKYFTYTASFGAFTEASYSAPQDIKNVLGQAAYLIEGIKSLTNIKPIHLKFESTEKTVEGDFLFGAISNSLSVGGVVKLDKAQVELNDGIFEVVLIRKPDNLIQLQSVIDGILRHDLNREGIEFFHSNKITVSMGKDVPWTLDGEYVEGADTVLIENIHSAIELTVPDIKE